jgi:hypothetical protein
MDSPPTPSIVHTYKAHVHPDVQKTIILTICLDSSPTALSPTNPHPPAPPPPPPFPSTRTCGPRRPEVVCRSHALDALRVHPDHIPPDSKGLVILLPASVDHALTKLAGYPARVANPFFPMPSRAPLPLTSYAYGQMCMLCGRHVRYVHMYPSCHGHVMSCHVQ